MHTLLIFSLFTLVSAAELNGWYNRTTSHSEGSSYHPTAENFAFGAMRSTRVNPSEFTVAFFKPDVVIDARGRVRVVQKQEFDELEKLAKRVDGLPKPDNFQHQWRVKHRRTEQAIKKLVIGSSGIEVYGHDGKSLTLESPVETYQELPEDLNTLLSLTDEARGQGQEDREMIEQAKVFVNKD